MKSKLQQVSLLNFLFYLQANDDFYEGIRAGKIRQKLSQKGGNKFYPSNANQSHNYDSWEICLLSVQLRSERGIISTVTISKIAEPFFYFKLYLFLIRINKRTVIVIQEKELITNNYTFLSFYHDRFQRSCYYVYFPFNWHNLIVNALIILLKSIHLFLF